MAQSIREIIQTTELLEVGDTVEFTDDEGVEHEGEIVEKQHHDEHRDALVKSTGDTPDSVLETYYDPEGGPVTVRVSFESQDTRDVTHIEQTN